MSQQECYEYLKRKKGVIKTTKEVSKACKINMSCAARNLRKLSENGEIERIEGSSKNRSGQIGYFWRYNGRIKLATDE